MSENNIPIWKSSSFWTTTASIFLVLISAFVIYNKYFNNSQEVSSQSENSKDNWAEAVQKEAQTPEGKVKYNEMETPPSLPNSINTKVAEDSIDIEAITEEEFVNFAKEALKIMPRQKDLQNLKPQEVHHFPEPIQKAGQKLGVIKDILIKRPDLEDAGIEFYENCASDDGAMTSVRALCLSNLAQYKAQKGEVVDFSKYPERVIELASETLKP